MMLRYIFLLLLGATTILATSPPASAQRGDLQMSFGGQSIDAMIADYMAENGVPGMALAIVQAPYIPRLTGYGLADTEKRLLVSMNTLFDIGQMAEGFTAVAVMQLVEAGKLRLEDPIGKHLPDLPKAWQSISVHALLAHASGIPDYTHETGFDMTREYSPAELIALVANKPPAFKPGKDIADSATDYLLLARLIETASGMSYRDYLRRNQFEQLGLQNIVFADEADRIRSEPVERNDNRHKEFLTDAALINPTERASGYREGLSPASPASISARLGSGGILATAFEISRWDIGLAGDLLIKDAGLRNALYAPVTLPDGRSLPVNGGWRFPGRKGLMYITGSASGHSAFLSRFTDPSELVCVTLLANKEGLDLTQLARRIAGAYDQRLGPPPGKDLRVQQSPYPARQTIDRFAAVIQREKLGRMGRISDVGGVTTATITPPAPEPVPAGMGTAPQIRVTAWEEKGQVWLGLADKGASPAYELRRRLDAALLKAVSPY